MSEIPQNDLPVEPTNNLPVTENITKTEKKRKYQPMIPRSHSGISLLGKAVEKKWHTNTDLKLVWLTADALASKVDEHEIAFTTKEVKNANTHPMSERLGELDEEMNEKIELVKNWIKFVENKTRIGAYLPAYGILRNTRGSKLPSRRDRRILALPILINKLKETNYPADKPANIAYWENMLEEYTSLYNQKNETKGEVSVHVSSKNELKDDLNEMLTAIVNGIRANFPRKADAMLREWGFLKENN